MRGSPCQANGGIAAPPVVRPSKFPSDFLPKIEMASYDVIFIGGGPAGYIGAIRAAQLGLSVGVVEKEGLGGTCVLWGCIPAKALLEAAAIANRVKHAAEFGVNVGDVKTDYNVAMKRSRGVSSQHSKGVEFLFKKNKITWIKGTAK